MPKSPQFARESKGRQGRAFRRLLLLVAFFAPAAYPAMRTYVGDLGPDYVLLAWGDTSSDGNTIGLTSTPLGRARVRVGDQTLDAEQNWVIVRGLKPDTAYPWEVRLGERLLGQGRVRTYPAQTDQLCFLVIGDWGNATGLQYRVAEVMTREFQRRENSGNPVRFVISTGDNLYGEVGFGFSVFKRTGDRDRDWEDRFFRPYNEILQHIPFHPSLGNHDGNESEARGDLAAYLDNFFFPNNRPSRWYTFSFGGLADFFALDSTMNTDSGPIRAAYAPGGEQHRWLQSALSNSKVPWKIPYFHHPPFNAGPHHSSSFEDLQHFVDLFQQQGVKVVFNGHEHNFQFTEQSPNTRGIRFVTSGAGGELRRGDVRRNMPNTHTAGWSAQAHFSVVEIQGKTMRITPVSFEPMRVVDAQGREVTLPVPVDLP